VKFGNGKLTRQKIVPVLGALFCLAVLCSNLAAVYVAAREAMCEMACCRGRAPHLAKDCSGGFCHFPPKKERKAEPKIFDETICGTKNFKARRLAEFHAFLIKQPSSNKIGETGDNFAHSVFHKHEAKDAAGSNAVWIRSFALHQSCRSDCGTATTNFNLNQKKFIRAATPVSTFAAQPRPPTRAFAPAFNFAAKIKLNRISRRISPRAPPTLV
jgi:hypothetical protein